MSTEVVVAKSPIRIDSGYYMKQYDFEQEVVKGIGQNNLTNIEEVKNNFLIFVFAWSNR